MAQWWAKWRDYSYRMGVPNSSQRKGKFDVAHLGAQCLRNSCRLGGPHLFRAGRIISGAPLVSGVAT